MLKRTLYFGNPAYLRRDLERLMIMLPDGKLAEAVPLADIGIVVLDNPQITITQAVLAGLLERNVAVVHCDLNHMPNGLMLPLSGHSVQQERFEAQINASEPLRKQLWQQTARQKILNQAAVLRYAGKLDAPLIRLADTVKSGDPENVEGRAAAYYWHNVFDGDLPEFYRGRALPPPNNMLNFGYAILRAIVARALVSSGLLPTLGIHHHNRYNAYCLADDIMEPYRPYVDIIVLDIVRSGVNYEELTVILKSKLLRIAAIDTQIDGITSPLMIAATRTAASLVRCFEGEQRKISYPVI